MFYVVCQPDNSVDEIHHTLIYATDKDPNQLRDVNSILLRKGAVFHQLTAEETRNRKLMRAILQSFRQGEIKILTAKRVLDEGVNVPEIETAYILASTTVERQWVQRRGRVLRNCRETNKEFATIHDFLVLPPTLNDLSDIDARNLIKQELRRVMEFASIARNAGKPDGAAATIDKVVRDYFGTGAMGA
jgi:superfamily II DNA or RNA helicase